MRITKTSVKKAVIAAFKDIKINQQFSGIEFKRMCVSYAPELKNKYVDTFLRLLRYTHHGDYICVNRSSSKYQRIA